MPFQIVLPNGEAREITREGIVAGRGRECQIQFDDTKVSRRHAIFWIDGDHAFLRDEGSTNGTLVNGSPVQGGVVVELHAADSVQIGNQTLRVDAVMAPGDAGVVTPIDIEAVDAAPEVQPRGKAATPVLVGAGALLLVFAIIAVALLAGRGGNTSGQAALTPGAATDTVGTAVAAATVAPGASQTPAAPSASDTPAPIATSTSSAPAATNAPDAIVASDTLNLRSGPGTGYDVLGKLSRAAVLTVVGQFNNCTWLQVRSPVGDGWVAGTREYVALRVSCGDVPAGTFRPKTGLLRKPAGGAGELTVENTTANDAVLVLAATSGKPVASAYIRAGENLKINGIPDGLADTLFYASGSDWDGKQFTQNPSYQKFDQTLDFTTTANNYMTYKVTLQAINGNTTATRVQPEDFPSAQ